MKTVSGVYGRVVCGVDHSEAGIAAARAAARVAEQDGTLTIVAADDTFVATWGKDGKAVEGDPLRVLTSEIEEQDATLAVVGSHGIRRVTGIALGAVSTHLLHYAPCSVLIARGEIDRERWPRRIVVGLDGSEESARAYAAAQELAGRYDVPLRAVTATQDAHVDLEAARRIAPDLEEHDARALDVLNVASETADLVVVGSRGLRGVRALGSLSERLAHEARSPVLVVRAAGQAA